MEMRCGCQGDMEDVTGCHGDEDQAVGEDVLVTTAMDPVKEESASTPLGEWSGLTLPIFWDMYCSNSFYIV